VVQVKTASIAGRERAVSDSLRFEVDGTGEARAEIATMIATGHADRWQVRYARWRVMMAMVGAGMLALIVVMLLARLITGGPPSLLLGVGAAMIGAGAWNMLARRSVARLVGGLSDPSPVMDGPQVWTFDAGGVRIVSDVVDSQFTWRAFDRVLEGQSALGLASGAVYFAMPFEDAEARGDLLERIEAWMQA